MDPDDPSHANPAPMALFNAALPLVAKILAAFDDDHPVIKDFNQILANEKAVKRRRGAGDWMATYGLVLTPELEAVLSDPLGNLLIHRDLSHLREPVRNDRVMRVGSALLQLAVQNELSELLNLNGDLLADLRDHSVVAWPTGGIQGLHAMFAAIPLASTKSSVLVTYMLKFKRGAHAISDPNFRPLTFHRGDPSFFPSCEAIPVVVKRRGDDGIDDERPGKRVKLAKTNPEQTVKKSRRSPGGRRGD
ncbi:hypothetical protein DFH09DRAFT_1109732 [Mycena vulgaris]|nr:hypothetical protein DFH09DRAFT_1109732 [Mycena vulgaris]